MTMRTKLSIYIGLIFPLIILQEGCTDVLGFSTATKFALDISQRADQSIDVSLGYDRVEVASIPVDKKKQDAKTTTPPSSTGNTDAYSVLGSFKVSYGNPFSVFLGEEEPFVLDQFFATGMAARKAANTPGLQEFFGTEAGIIVNKKALEEIK